MNARQGASQVLKMREGKWAANASAGMLIAFEGISGCGKSESIRRLSVQLDKQGIDYVIVEWNAIESIRRIVDRLESMGLLTSVVYSLLQWLSFIISYYRQIAPALKKKQIVLADRYIYTAMTRDKANGAGRFISGLLSLWVRKPEWVVYYELPPEICLERIRKRGKALFHTNRKLKADQSLQDKELAYLKLLHAEYGHLYQRAKHQRKTRWIRIQDADTHSDVVIAQHIFSNFNEPKNSMTAG
jgi:dTMP kinase